MLKINGTEFLEIAVNIRNCVLISVQVKDLYKLKNTKIKDLNFETDYEKIKTLYAMNCSGNSAYIGKVLFRNINALQQNEAYI